MSKGKRTRTTDRLLDEQVALLTAGMLRLKAHDPRPYARTRDGRYQVAVTERDPGHQLVYIVTGDDTIREYPDLGAMWFEAGINALYDLEPIEPERARREGRSDER